MSYVGRNKLLASFIVAPTGRRIARTAPYLVVQEKTTPDMLYPWKVEYKLYGTFVTRFDFFAGDAQGEANARYNAERALLEMLYAPVYAHMNRLANAARNCDEGGVIEIIEKIKREVGL